MTARTGLLVVAGVACSNGSATCVAATFTREAQAALDVVAAQVDFTLVPPCGFGPGFVVTSVIGDTLPGALSQRRVSFIVERSGQRL